jgi:hypothetical protein
MKNKTKLISFFIALDQWSLAQEQKLNAFSDRYFSRPIAIAILSFVVSLLFLALWTVPHLFKN